MNPFLRSHVRRNKKGIPAKRIITVSWVNKEILLISLDSSQINVKDVNKTIGSPSKIAAKEVFFLLNSEAITMIATATSILIK
ncbi:MAG: hypothetical protein CMH24_00490 [Nitrosomonadales bacterium]|nr:hypothetical protein [Nitrosomonadales bacterium]